MQRAAREKCRALQQRKRRLVPARAGDFGRRAARQFFPQAPAHRRLRQSPLLAALAQRLFPDNRQGAAAARRALAGGRVQIVFDDDDNVGAQHPVAGHAAAVPDAVLKAVGGLVQNIVDLPGGPGHLIRFTVRRQWSVYRSQPSPDACTHRCVEFATETDLAIRHGLIDCARTRLTELLDRDYLGNVFQYRSEHWIFDAGSKGRGLNSRRDTLRRRLAELDALIGQEQARRSEWFNTNLAVIALVFTLLQIVPLNGLGEWLGLTAAAASGWAGVLLDASLGLLFLLFLLVLLGRRVDPLIYMRALAHAGRSLAEKELKALA